MQLTLKILNLLCTSKVESLWWIIGPLEAQFKAYQYKPTTLNRGRYVRVSTKWPKPVKTKIKSH